MLKRLGALIGFVFFWIISAMAMPIVFWVIGGIILTLTIIHVVREKEGFQSAARFFTGVGAVTILLATAGFFMGGSEPDFDDGSAFAAVDDIDDDDDGDVEEGGDEGGETAEAEGDEGDEGGGGEAAPVPEIDVKAVIKTAMATAKKPKECKSLEAIAAAWQQLSLVPAGDKQFKKATKAANGLERCRKKAATALQKGAVKTRAKERNALAKDLKKELAEAGLKLKAKAQGKTKNKLAFKGNKKVTEEQIDTAFGGDASDETSLLGRLQAAGFAKVTVAAGKIKRDFKLQPGADDAEVVAQLEQLGMNEPLKLQ